MSVDCKRRLMDKKLYKEQQFNVVLAKRLGQMLWNSKRLKIPQLRNTFSQKAEVFLEQNNYDYNKYKEQCVGVGQFKYLMKSPQIYTTRKMKPLDRNDSPQKCFMGRKIDKLIHRCNSELKQKLPGIHRRVLSLPSLNKKL